MDLFQQLRERRVFQITSAYVVGGFGLIQFLEFLEGRMALSPNLVNLVGLAGLLLMPSVVMLAWALGRPGRDSLGRTEKWAVPANILAAAALLFVVFQGKELGAVTHTVEVTDEHGAVSEREVPKQEFRRRLLVFYLDEAGEAVDEWMGETASMLLVADADQDIFLNVDECLYVLEPLLDAGHPDGRDLPRPLMRKLAADAHYDHYCSGSVERAGETWRLVLDLHDTERGGLVSSRVHEGSDFFALVDAATLDLRADLGLPESHIATSPDLPVAEVTTADLAAARGYEQGLHTSLHGNDWEGAVAPLEDAVARDPGFALAHFQLFANYQTVGRAEDSAAAMAVAMDHLYRVTERMSFQIRTQYYFNIEQDMDKSMAVMEMWTRLYPADVQARAQKALYHFIRQELEASLAEYEAALEIDPSQYHLLEPVADRQRQLGRLDEAEATLNRYVDLFPGRTDGYRNLADFYRDTGRLDEARTALDQARLLEPGDLDLALAVIDLDLKLGRYAETEAALDERLAASDAPLDQAKIHARRIDLARLRGRGDDLAVALDDYYASMSAVQNPMQLDLIISLMAPMLSEVGRPDECLARVDAATARIPESFKDLTCVGRAWALADLERIADARAELERATAIVEQLQFETFRPTLFLIEGMIAEIEGDLPAAVAAFREALDSVLQIEPFYHARLGRALRRNGDTRAAREVLEDGLALHPAHPLANLELAQVHLADGREDEARTHLAAARAAWDGSDPTYAPAAEAAELARRLERTP